MCPTDMSSQLLHKLIQGKDNDEEYCDNDIALPV